MRLPAGDGAGTSAEAGGILRDIERLRRARLRAQGHDQGVPLPSRRTAPIVPFSGEPFLICEIKRRSPSRGAILLGADAVEQARAYVRQGVRRLSVLTEQDRFSGSLADLVRIKQAFPDCAVLRKDFLLDEEDVEASWRAGADAVLLIASLLEGVQLAAMHAAAVRRGMQALVEVHDAEDVAKCRELAPPLVGINSRDLKTFRVDLLGPVALRPKVTWEATTVFESGIRSAEDVRLARSAGFDGVLLGETAMRDPRTIPELMQAMRLPPAGFWKKLCSRRVPGRPLVKICGVTRVGDARLARDLGADAVGFVFAPSKRRADPAILRDLTDLDIPKVAVVVSENGAHARPSGPAGEVDMRELLAEGLIDAVQFHGAEQPQECASLAFPYYKAVRVRTTEDVRVMGAFRCPRVLTDAWSAAAAGGTGQQVDPGLALQAREAGPLWLAGGIGPDNVGQILDRLSPELIDASSGLEESPGRKDPSLLARYFEEIRRHAGL